MRENQHRWKEWLKLEGDEIRQLLEDAIEKIAWAWETDKTAFPGSYPANTGELFFQLQNRIMQIQGCESTASSPSARTSGIVLAPPPRCFSELVNDRPIKVIYEDQNADRYEDALKRAARGDHKTFRKILKAVHHAYRENKEGVWAVPMPRTNFLHRNLIEIARISGLVDDLKDEGMVEFIDDMCPCGNVHQLDAIRKLIERSGGRSEDITSLDIDEECD
jgi:hypothetical protein